MLDGARAPGENRGFQRASRCATPSASGVGLAFEQPKKPPCRVCTRLSTRAACCLLPKPYRSHRAPLAPEIAPHAAYLVASVQSRLCASSALSACSSGARRALQPAQPAQPRTAWAACPARRRHIHRAAPGSATRMESLHLRHGCSCLPLIACTAELAHQPSHAPSPPLYRQWRASVAPRSSVA